MLREVGGVPREVLAAHGLDERRPARPALRGGEPATLAWICFHVLQEYARHAGHLDVAVELAGGDGRRVRRSEAGDALAAVLGLLVEVLVLEQVQHRDADLAAGARGPVEVEELRDDVRPGQDDRLAGVDLGDLRRPAPRSGRR